MLIVGGTPWCSPTDTLVGFSYTLFFTYKMSRSSPTLFLPHGS